MTAVPSMVKMRTLLAAIAVSSLGLIAAACGGGDAEETGGPIAGRTLTNPAEVPTGEPISGDLRFTIRDNGISAPGGLSTTVATGAATPAASTNTYTLESGDTCYAVADTLGVSLDQLLEANPRLDCDQLQPGDQVRVPAGGTGGDTPTATPAAGETPSGGNGDDSGGGGTYTIQPGDICVTIAESQGVNVDELIALNGLDCSNLQPGTVIQLP